MYRYNLSIKLSKRDNKKRTLFGHKSGHVSSTKIVMFLDTKTIKKPSPKGWGLPSTEGATDLGINLSPTDQPPTGQRASGHLEPKIEKGRCPRLSAPPGYQYHGKRD